jgi:hypothetical protein
VTAKQTELLKRLIQAERCYRNAREANDSPSQEMRWVEVGWINGVDPRTARSLVDAGLCESMQGWNETQTVIWLKDDYGPDLEGS